MTEEDKRVLYRVGLLNQKRLEPPRSIRFDGDLVSWDAPAETGNVTHYNVRVGSDTAPVKYRFPVGTTSFRPSTSDTDFFVSSWNETMKKESYRVALAGQVASTGPSAPPGHVTDLGVTVLGLEKIRGQYHVLFSVAAKAPEAAEFNGFDGVYVHHFGSKFSLGGLRTETPWLPVECEPGAAFAVEFSVIAPYETESQGIRVVARGESGATADYATAPTVTVLEVPGQKDAEMGDVEVVPPLTPDWQTSGDLRLHALRANSAGYVPPYVPGTLGDIGDFIGVALFWVLSTEPDSPYSAGTAPYTGNPAGSTPDHYGEVDVTIPRGKIPGAGTYYLVLRPYGKSQFPVWKPHYRVPSDSYFTVTIAAQDLTDNPSDGTTPTGPTGVTPVVTPGPTDDTYYPGVRFTPASSLGSTVGYAHAYRFWSDSGKTSLWYPTDGSWIDAGDKLGANLSEIRADLAQRDSLTVYMEARVAPINERYERGSWVVSSGTAPVYPPSANTPGSAASVAITIGAGTDSRSYVVNSTLTPPSPLGPAVAWEAWLAFYTASTGGSPYLVNQVHDWIDINDTSEPFGPYTRGVDYEPWAELRVRLIYSHGAKSDWIVSPRAQVGKQAAPTTSVTNLSTVEYDTISGVPSYRIVRKATFSGSKDAVDWTDMTAFFYTNSGGTVLDGEIPIGGIDPSINQTWPITVESRTDWWALPDYDVWYKIGIRIKNSDGVAGAWVYTTLAKLNKSAGFDAGGVDPTKLGDTLVLSDGKLTNYALTYLSKWGLSSDDFDTSLGNVIIKNAVIARLLAQTITVTGDMTISRGSGASLKLTSSSIVLDFLVADVILNQDGIQCYKGMFSGEVAATSYRADGIQFAYRHGTSGITLEANRVTCSGTFTHSGSTVSITSASAWRSALGLVIGTDVAAQSHNHDSAYAAASHNHSGVYAAADHNHSGVYAPAYLDATDIAYNANGFSDVGNALNNLFSRVSALE